MRMIILPVVSSIPVRRVCFCALSTLLVLIVVRLSIYGIEGLSYTCTDFLAASSVVLLLTNGNVERKTFFPCVVAYSLVLVLTSSIRFRPLSFQSVSMRLVYGVLLTIPHCFQMSSDAYVRLNEIEREDKHMTSLEFLIYEMEMVYLIYFFSLVVICQSVTGQDGNSVARYIVLSLSIPLFIILMIRRLFANQQKPVNEERKEAIPISIPDLDIADVESLKDMKPAYIKVYCRLREYMDNDRSYLSAECQLEDVARAVLTNKTYLSKVVNMCSGLNFSQFINYYRINYAISLFKEDQHLKVAQLAERSGFNNLVTFNMAFKYFMKVTPSEWCRNYIDELNIQRHHAKMQGHQP